MGSDASTANSRAYSTEKLTFAAYLIATDRAKLLGTNRAGAGRKVAFLLSQEPLPEEVTAFFNGSATVSALRFAEAINTLKGAAFELRKCHG